jgi:hypothetical protein
MKNKHQRLFSIAALLMTWATLFISHPALALSVGDRVSVSWTELNVRSGPSTSGTTIYATQHAGEQGVIFGGPQTGSGYTWWNINWDDGYSGWSVQDGLAVVPTTPTVSSVIPSILTQGTGTTVVVIYGSNFTSSSYHEFSIDGGSMWNPAQRAPTVIDSTSMTVWVVDTITRTVHIRVCASYGSSACSGRVTVTIQASGPATPTVSSINPTSMTADGASHTLTTNGGNFQSGNVVQFKWGVPPNAGVWNNSSSTPTINSSNQMTVSMNPGTVNDTIYMRVCRSSTQTTSADCSSGTHSVTVSRVSPPLKSDLIPQNIAPSSSTLAPGASFTASWTLTNTGSGAANAESTTVVRINQSSSSAAGTNLASISTAALGGGSSVWQSAGLTAPPTPGTYYVWVLADNYSTVTNQSNTANDLQHSAAIQVNAAPKPTCKLLAPPSIIMKGQSATLMWSSHNVTSGSINNDIGVVSTAGSQTISPKKTTTYVATFTGTGGSVSCRATVLVFIRQPAKDRMIHVSKIPPSEVDAILNYLDRSIEAYDRPGDSNCNIYPEAASKKFRARLCREQDVNGKPQYSLAFRGTIITSAADWATNINQLRSNGGANATVHYNEALSALLWAQIKLKDSHGANYDLTLTGHSLGGGLAQYADTALLVNLRPVKQVVTFNSAGLSDQTIQSLPDTASARLSTTNVVHVINYRDVIPIFGHHLSGSVVYVEAPRPLTVIGQIKNHIATNLRSSIKEQRKKRGRNKSFREPR